MINKGKTKLFKDLRAGFEMNFSSCEKKAFHSNGKKTNVYLMFDEK